MCVKLFHFCSCRDNCARKTSLSGFKILGTVCSDNCRTKFGGLSYVWRMYRRSDDTHGRQRRDTNDWVEYTDLDALSDTGMQGLVSILFFFLSL